MGTGKDVLVMGLKKVHVIVAALTAIVTPSVVVTAGYYKAKSELENKINTIQVQNVNTFARSDDVKAMAQTLTKISNDLSEIKGEMKFMNRSSRRHVRYDNEE